MCMYMFARCKFNLFKPKIKKNIYKYIIKETIMNQIRTDKKTNTAKRYLK